jgi:hypothetical protein
MFKFNSLNLYYITHLAFGLKRIWQVNSWPRSALEACPCFHFVSGWMSSAFACRSGRLQAGPHRFFHAGAMAALVLPVA